MEFKKLNHAITLAREGSFAKAAERLPLSQPALTRSIQSLERELGIVLFDRLPSGVRLTATGTAILGKAQEILRSVNGLSREAELIRESRSGSLSFGVAPVPGQLFLPGLLTETFKHSEGVKIHVQTESSELLRDKLLEESIEFFVAPISQVATSNEIESKHLSHIPLGFYVRRGHPLLSMDKLTPQNLHAYPLASQVKYNSQIPLLSEDPLDLQGWPSKLACENISVLRSVAIETDAILMTSRKLIEGELASKELIALDNSSLTTLQPVAIGLFRLSNRSLSPLANSLINKLEAQTNDANNA